MRIRSVSETMMVAGVQVGAPKHLVSFKLFFVVLGPGRVSVLRMISRSFVVVVSLVCSLWVGLCFSSFDMMVADGQAESSESGV